MNAIGKQADDAQSSTLHPSGIGENAAQRDEFSQVADWDPAAVEALIEATRLGVGRCYAHHGEILQGMFYDDDGQNTRALVTLPCPLFCTTAKFLTTPQREIVTFPNGKRKAHKAATLALQEAGHAGQGGLLFLANESPEGWGLGSSTSDVVATIRAVADSFRMSFDQETIAKLAVQAEVASDSIMFENSAVLFAQRQGKLLETFSNKLPPVDVIGFDTDSSHQGIDTLLYPPAEYTWQEIEEFRPLHGLLRRAIDTQDAGALGKVATSSARINQRYLPKPKFDELLDIAEDCGAVGIQVAHSGSIVGFMFDCAEPVRLKGMARSVSMLRSLGFPACHRFSTLNPR
ncbi:kinase [Mesorhizobium sp.]|uniref:GHMP family kinase ATP-binding protein n=1 Tax=Mesorhizobium sp. TaxID=1871066 RepID=UPI00257F6F48|nr:kinase [Mesorhizobium sp.]